MKMILPKNTVFDLIKRHKERFILGGAIVLFLILVGGGIALQKDKKSGKEYPPESQPKAVKLKIQDKKESVEPAEEHSQSASFLLKPSPNELLQQLTSLENFTEGVVAAKYTGLRVLWPVYFFTLQTSGENKATLVLDVAEDGFGIVIESEVDISIHPQLGDLEQGKKLWIGGEILAVDRSGTGTVYLKTEHLHLGEDPFTSAGPVEENKK